MIKTNVPDLQIELFKEAKEQKKKITVILVNGVQVHDVKVVAYDRFTVLLSDPRGKQQLIYKHAISTIITSSVVKKLENR